MPSSDTGRLSYIILISAAWKAKMAVGYVQKVEEQLANYIFAAEDGGKIIEYVICTTETAQPECN